MSQLAAATGSLAARRVLLVEDEEVVRDVVTMMLEQQGFEVVAVEDALAALSACRAAHFDLLLTDLVMPSMNGVELAAAVQEQAPATRVVYMSGYSAEDVADSTPRVQKPFTSAELLNTLEKTLAA